MSFSIYRSDSLIINNIVSESKTPIYNAIQLNSTPIGNLSTISNNDVLIWNSATNQWIPGNSSPSGAINVTSIQINSSPFVDISKNITCGTINSLTLPTSDFVGINDTQYLTNKKNVDISTSFVNSSDISKIVKFDLSSISTATTRTLSMPNASDTIVCRNTTDTLTNKTITNPNITSEATPTPSVGKIYFDSTSNLMRYYDGTIWRNIGMTQTSAGLFQVRTATNNVIATSVSPTSPWTSNGTVIWAVNENDGYSSLFCTTHANGDWIALSFGTQSAGIYQLYASFVQYNQRGIVDISETTTSTAIISSLDTYQPGSSGTSLLTIRPSFVFNPSGGSGTMNIKFLINGKNASSGDYYVVLNNSVEIIRTA